MLRYGNIGNKTVCFALGCKMLYLYKVLKKDFTWTYHINLFVSEVEEANLL